MNLEKLKQVAEEMLVELYAKAEPPAKWSDLKKKYAGTKVRFFELHYLPQKENEKILEKYKKLIGKRWKRSLSMVWLDCAPTSNKNRPLEAKK